MLALAKCKLPRTKPIELHNMPVTIEHHVAVRMGGKAEWKVRQSNLLDIQGETFIKLPASEWGFVKLVCEKLVEGQLPKNASLSQCQGMRELFELRNAKQCEDLTPEPPSCTLFEASEQAQPNKRRPKRTLRELREAREAPGILTVEVPGCAGSEPMAVQMVRPVHPRDDLCVLLDAAVIERIVLYIRHAGITRDALASKRSYKASGYDAPKGIWRGSTGFIVKLPAAAGGHAGPKYKRVKTVDAAINVLANTDADVPVLADGDADDGADGAPDTCTDGEHDTGNESAESECEHAGGCEPSSSSQHASA